MKKKYSHLQVIKINAFFAVAFFLGFSETSFSQNKWTETQNDVFNVVKNRGGQTLAYSPASGVKLLSINGFAFKDLNKNGKLDKYEDWRLPVDVRAKDLATKLTIEQIAGLMLYSAHQSIPARAGGYFAGT
jgi:beta-glucosidase